MQRYRDNPISNSTGKPKKGGYLTINNDDELDDIEMYATQNSNSKITKSFPMNQKEQKNSMFSKWL